MIVKRGMAHRLLTSPRTRVMEAIAIELFIDGRRLIVASVCFPGSSDPRVLFL